MGVIRKELRETPKNLKLKTRSFRNLLLSYYDSLVKDRTLQLTRLADFLAQEYLNNYIGGVSKAKLRNDFLIIACATLNNIDIVVSEDAHTMLSSNAINAYKKANLENGLRTPNFYSINKLEKLL